MFDFFSNPKPKINREPLWKYEPAGWQKCPVCNGSGKIPNPEFTDPSFKVECEACEGKKLINKATGKPPKDAN